ncbi:MAG: ATP-dependent helicase HrpB [Hyphomicrobium sp.]|nr:ATP-dependent helicase HrpB [Hyphomicrobium sp.]
MRFDTPLPIDDVLSELNAALESSRSAVLVAPPGAGKTTRVPLALLDRAWLGRQKILVLEPRRIAARGAADRMARTLDERVGDTIGLRARLVSKSGPRTRVEVITEGVFTRMILDDPSLDGVGAVLFDEFHERALDADLGLALALDAQKALRDDLRILVMSATLDGARVASLLDSAPVIKSEGRAFHVETRYLGRDANRRIEDQVTDAIGRAVRAERGSLLVFLPGQGEIKRVEERLAGTVADPDIIIAPLYGAMDISAQDRAVEPAPPGKRKIVLATAIAETSLTIEGIRVVIDSGLQRVPRFEPDAGVTRLETIRVSRASADQRRGRAGRTEPGVCYRLWDEPQTVSLQPFTEPEILSADLSGVLLDLAEWGVREPSTLSWLDPPPAYAVMAARQELQTIGALEPDGRITAEGRRIRALPLPPRLARMVLAARSLQAAELAAILVERGLGGNDTDLEHRLSSFRRDRSRRAEDMRRLAIGWAKAAGAPPSSSDGSIAALLALAYPDRIAKARGAPGQFLLANGRGAYVDPGDGLAKSPFLVVAELLGTAAHTRILYAARMSEVEVLALARDRIVESDELTFDADAGAVRARRVRRLGSITLASESRPVTPSSETAALLARGTRVAGLDRLPWSKAHQQLRRRVLFLRAAEGPASMLPDLSDEALSHSVGEWLAPLLTHATKLTDIDAEVLDQALDVLIPWDAKRKLDAEAPTHFVAPTGNRHPIEYDGPGAPALSIRVQELYGLKEHPSIAGGRLPLTLNLLSPAHRPIQITRDLPGFWSGSWSALKSEMKGRYPRHLWPDDPAEALPTSRAKPRGT